MSQLKWSSSTPTIKGAKAPPNDPAVFTIEGRTGLFLCSQSEGIDQKGRIAEIQQNTSQQQDSAENQRSFGEYRREYIMQTVASAVNIITGFRRLSKNMSDIRPPIIFPRMAPTTVPLQQSPFS